MFGLTVVLLIVMVWLSAGREEAFDTILYGLLAFSLAGAGALIVSRDPGNVIGWIFCGLGVFGAVAECAEGYGYLAAERGLAAGAVGEWIILWSWTIDFTAWALVFLLFPDGHLLSRRWRPWLWVLAAGVALALPGQALDADLGSEFTSGSNPMAVAGLPTALLFNAGVALMLAALVAGVVCLVVRFRRGGSVERQQLRWMAFAASLLVVASMFAAFFWYDSVLVQVALALALITLPGAAGIAIFKYRLYDIDVVINRALVYGALAGFVSVVYVAVVVGVGRAIGTRGDNVGLSILATGLVAVGFEPVKARVQALANRLVYGQRATPYEVLSALSQRMADEQVTEERLARMAQLLAEGTAARRADVWLVVAGELRPAASWPAAGAPTEALALDGDGLPSLGAVTGFAPVRHEGELLGALAVRKPGAEVLNPVESKLLADLAGQAGLVLRNVRLTAELLDHVTQLRASRQRLVTAQDEARRRLERNLHDGAQQQLVALKVRLGLAERFAAKGKPVDEVLRQLRVDADDAIGTLRDLARGIYPPLLAAEGLSAALVAQARKAALPVRVEAGDIGRYDQVMEAAVYFCCLEALQNIAKYANATAACIRLETVDGDLSFTVSDDGDGFDQKSTAIGAGLTNMTDRIDALGGTLEIHSAVGAGTSICGRLPTATPSQALSSQALSSRA